MTSEMRLDLAKLIDSANPKKSDLNIRRLIEKAQKQLRVNEENLENTDFTANTMCWSAGYLQKLDR